MPHDEAFHAVLRGLESTTADGTVIESDSDHSTPEASINESWASQEIFIEETAATIDSRGCLSYFGFLSQSWPRLAG
jgi:hypothetical protein